MLCIMGSCWRRHVMMLPLYYIASKLQDVKEELDTHILYMTCYGI